MASGAAFSTRGAFQPATRASSTRGASQPPSAPWPYVPFNVLACASSPLPDFAPFSVLPAFDVGLGWTLTEAEEMRREIEGPAAGTSYRTPPTRVVSSDPLLRWGLLVAASLDEAAN